MKEKIDKAVRNGYNKYMVRHVPIEDKNDRRCRTEIMFEEIINNIMQIIDENDKGNKS